VEKLQYSKQAVSIRENRRMQTALSKPILGRIQLAVARIGMRFVNAVPSLKRKMSEQRIRLRNLEEIKASLPAIPSANGRSPPETDLPEVLLGASLTSAGSPPNCRGVNIRK
jgi:hypothetical protein